MSEKIMVKLLLIRMYTFTNSGDVTYRNSFLELIYSFPTFKCSNNRALSSIQLVYL